MEPRKQMRNTLATLTAVLAAAGVTGFGVGAPVLDDGATQVAQHVPAPPDGQSYMVWIGLPGSDPEPTRAPFTPRSDGSATASTPNVDTVLVNTEPPGGADAPTSSPILTAILT